MECSSKELLPFSVPWVYLLYETDKIKGTSVPTTHTAGGGILKGDCLFSTTQHKPTVRPGVPKPLLVEYSKDNYREK